MRRGALTVLAAVLAAAMLWAIPGPAQTKKLVFWTHWEQNPEFNKFYETRGKEFAQSTATRSRS